MLGKDFWIHDEKFVEISESNLIPIAKSINSLSHKPSFVINSCKTFDPENQKSIARLFSEAIPESNVYASKKLVSLSHTYVDLFTEEPSKLDATTFSPVIIFLSSKEKEDSTIGENDSKEQTWRESIEFNYREVEDGTVLLKKGEMVPIQKKGSFFFQTVPYRYYFFLREFHTDLVSDCIEILP